jgi:hypothetical protein
MQRFSESFSRRFMLPAAVFLAACLTVPAGAQAPSYTQAKPLWDKANREEYQTFRKQETLVRDILNGRMELSGQAQTDFQHFIVRQELAEMTLVSDLGNLANKRREFFRTRFQNTNPPKPAHDYLVKLTFDTAKLVSSDPRFNFHPAVRCNGMLIIAELNEVETSGFGANRTPPTPLPAALDFMLSELNNPNQIDQVKAAALVGVLRHAEMNRLLGKTANAQQSQNTQMIQKILAVVLPLAQQNDPPAGRSPEGHTWMRRRALDIFVAMEARRGQPLALLDSVVADADAPFSLRIAAAQAIGRLEFEGSEQGYDGAEAAQHFASLAADICQAELAWWEAEKKREEEAKLRGQGPGGMGPGGMTPGYGDYGGDEMAGGEYGESDMYAPGGYGAGMYGDPSARKAPEKKKTEYRLEKTQRRLKYVLAALKTGLDGNPEVVAKGGRAPDPPPEDGGVLVRSSDQHKPRVKQVADAVTAMFLSVDKAEPERETMLAELQTHLARMQTLAGVVETGPPGSDAGSGPAGPPGSVPAGRGPSAPPGGPPGAAPGGPSGRGPTAPPCAAPGGPPQNAPGGA